MDSKDKYKKLELLVDQLLARMGEREKEIIALKARIKLLESENRLNKSTQETVNALMEWKEITTLLLKRLYLKIDKEILRIESQVATPKIDK
ncbi:MAG: hypothetical protein II183_01010 [Elusimicrobiaceae bacterium]|nr:hypothetical protein [Elusimicrobiaceae bacterium]MBQ3933756.1 hypothetical protein [Elusimicrobiaceae bacterium]